MDNQESEDNWVWKLADKYDRTYNQMAETITGMFNGEYDDLTVAEFRAKMAENNCKHPFDSWDVTWEKGEPAKVECTECHQSWSVVSPRRSGND